MAEIKGIQWAKLLKYISLSGSKGISVYELCRKLDLKPGDASVEITIGRLLEQRKIRISMGRDTDGKPCRVVQTFVPARVSTREIEDTSPQTWYKDMYEDAIEKEEGL